MPLSPTLAYDFANGEIFVRFQESVRGCDAFVLQSHTTPINKWIMEQLHHGRRAQARVGQAHHRDRAVLRLRPAGQEAPRPRAHLRPPDRRPVQDRRRRPAHDGRPAHLADPGLLRRPRRPPLRDAAAGEARRRPACPARTSPSSRPTPAACAWPSAGPTCSAPRWRSSTSAATPTCPNQVRVFEVVGDVRGRVCVLVDDMIDTGGTIVKAAETLFENGAKDVIVAATHGILSDPARERLQESRISRGRRHQHAADPRRPPLPEAHGPVDRPDPRQGDHRGLHRRIRDEHVRRRLARVRGVLALSRWRAQPGADRVRALPGGRLSRNPRRGWAAGSLIVSHACPP